jgi:hypothetical protein
MPRKLIDITGQRFGRLVAIEIIARPGNTTWRCKCDCGGESTSGGSDLRSGRVESCGCIRRERAATVLAKLNTRHGLSKAGPNGRGTPEYAAWARMRRRCETPTDRVYRHYGGRGITVCQRWRESFEAFLADMGPRPGSNLSLDRLDVNGNYEPGNCRWATQSEQMRNTRRNRYVLVDGARVCVSEAAERLGTTSDRIRGMVKRGELCPA